MFLPAVPTSPYGGEPLVVLPYEDGLVLCCDVRSSRSRPLTARALVQAGRPDVLVVLFGDAYHARYRDRDEDLRDAFAAAAEPAAGD